MAKKNCINCPKMFYTGNEKSPLRFGLSAEGYDINSAMEGYDNKLWAVEIKNNKKVWVKCDNILKISKEDPILSDETEKPNIIEENKDKNRTNDYTIYIKYKLENVDKNTDNKELTKKQKFDSIRLEWQQLKKDKNKLKKELEDAKKWYEKWFEENKGNISKRKRVIKIDNNI